MTTKKITNTFGTVQSGLESAWNRIVMGVRTRKMPKTIKRVKETFSKGTKHSGLSSNWEQEYRERDMLDHTAFYSQYMGSTLVEELVNQEPGANYYNTGQSTKALDRIVRMSRHKSLVQVNILVNSSGIQVVKGSDKSTLLQVPMERITFSTNDRKYSKVTAFIAKNNVNDTMECHAFLCHRQKMAKAIADALSLAYVQHKEAALKTEANNTQPPDTQLSKGDNFNIDNNVSTANGHLVDCENNEKALEINFKSQSEENHIESKPEENHNLVELTEPTPTITNLMPRHTTTDFLIDDSNTEPVMRARADSDSWAVMATGADSASNDDLELEFSNFARSRSTTNLADLHTSVHSAWDI